MLIYLHGFRSSPASFKARLLQRHFDQCGLTDQFACPQLPVSPQAAIDLVQAQFNPGPDDTLLGSSLGGYYATWLAERSGCRTILINPAIEPARDLQAYIGPLRTYHDDQPMHLLASHIDELRVLHAGPITDHSRYFLIAAKGDELLDWREMVARYESVTTTLIEGGDHGLTDFAEHIDSVIRFAGYGHPHSGQHR